jgi:hypothetical protein
MSGDYMQGDKDQAVIVPFSDDESAAASDTEALEEDKPTDSPEERVTRKRRRQERLNRLITEGKQSKEELASVKAELERLKGEQAAIQRQVATAQRPANDTAQPDPYEKQLDAIYERQAEAYASAQAEVKAGTFTPDRQKHWERVGRDIESAKTRIHTQRLMDEQAHSRRAEQAQQVWVQKYPDVYQNPKAFQYAQATYQRRKALGEVDSNDLVDDIMRETMTQFRLGAKPAPSATERSRMSGVPAAGSGGSSKPAGIVMNPAFERMAKAAYPELSDADAIKKWAQGTGKRLREKKVI